MKRTIWTIKSNEGYLFDIERYTTDVTKAVEFTDLDTALRRLALVRYKLKLPCWVSSETISFPREKPLSYG